YHGMMPRIASATSVAAMYSRSAAGSSTWPSWLCWFQARASLPSSQSEIPATTSRPTAHQSALGPSTSQRKTGTPASLATLIAFGTVRMRALGSACTVRVTVASPSAGIIADSLLTCCAHRGGPVPPSVLAGDGHVPACLERRRARLRLVVGTPFRHRGDAGRHQLQPGHEVLEL